MDPVFILVMGVSGSGKSTLAKTLAKEMDMPFYDADDLHPKSNVEKMSRGEPLSDADREPWLELVRTTAERAALEQEAHSLRKGPKGVVIACSALKRHYRDVLRGLHRPPNTSPSHLDHPRQSLTIRIVFISGSRELLLERMNSRKGHFMKTDMLESQLQTLENPEGERDVITVRLEDSTEEQVRFVMGQISSFLGVGAEFLDATEYTLPPTVERKLRSWLRDLLSNRKQMMWSRFRDKERMVSLINLRAPSLTDPGILSLISIGILIGPPICNTHIQEHSSAPYAKDMALLTKVTLNWTKCFGALACLVVLRWIFRTRRLHKGLRFPPGPPGKFIVGNVADLPTEQGWKTVTQWGKEYGDLVHLKVMRTHMIYINSAKVAYDLFEKRSSIYSDRFISPMTYDLMGSDWLISFMPYGEKWRRHRKTFSQRFQQASVGEYLDIQTRQTRAFLNKLHKSPKEFMRHVRHLSGAIIMEVTYGIRVQPNDDPYVRNAEEAMSAFIQAAIPGDFLVDTFPILKYVPAWMPGAGFHRKALAWRKPIAKMATAPFEAVKKDMAAGTAQPSSFVASLMEDISSRRDVPPDEEIVLRDTAGAIYLGGADTTVSAINSFFLAMVLYPEVQRKAQAEIDALIGDRLPEFGDRDDLPYVNAMCKEVLRWNPVAPLGIPHMVSQDDVYGDFFIPGGSVVIGNAWAMLRDEKEYGPETGKFQPERFLRPGVKEPTFAFGFGRRICPGRYMADNSVFIAVASILKTFDISIAKDSDGNDIPVKDAYASGILSHPEPFQCSIKPRLKAEEFLRDL